MEGISGGTDECSKTCSHGNQEKKKNIIHEYYNKHKDGGSPSNSTVEENENKPSVRSYVRTKMPRLRWTPDLHLRFIQAVETLGGQNRATPKLVLQLMNIKGLNIAHVKSHLQLYRSKKIDDPNQGIVDHMHILEGADQNLYNLSERPMLSGFNQNHGSTFRNGDASWEGLENLPQLSATRQSFNMTRPGFYDTLMGRNSVSWSHNLFSSGLLNSNPRSSSSPSSGHANDLKCEILQSVPPQKECEEGNEFKSSKQMQPKEVEDLSGSSNKSNLSEKLAGVKRKAANCNVKLSLGLGPSSNGCRLKQQDLDDEEDNGQLSLSLRSSPRFSKQRRFIGVTSKENGWGTSTLDLSL